MYLTYSEYTSYGGTLTETEFNNLEYNAETLINYYTFDRLVDETTLPTEVKRLTKYLIDLGKKQDDAMALDTETGRSSFMTEQSNDGVTVRYSRLNAEELFSLCKVEAKLAINRYLSRTENSLGQKVLFRGLYKGE